MRRSTNGGAPGTAVHIDVELRMASGHRKTVFAKAILIGDSVTIEDPTGLELTIKTKKAKEADDN